MAWLITALIVVPIVGALLVGATRNYARGVALAFNLITAIGAFLLWRSFDSTLPGLQLVERHSWIPAIGAEYLVGIDGLSLLLVILTSLVFPFALLAQSRPAGDRGFCALMLIMQAALYGTFTAQNFILWFLFYEMSLIPAFLLIKIWGGEWLAFAGIFLGLAVKVPLFPFHTWLPDAYEAAPTGVSMVLTGTLSKMGVYGFVRLLLPLFPNEITTMAPWLLTLAVCSIVIAPLAAWAQSDLKRMVAYLSINHLGYCMLGLFAVTATAARPLVETEAALSGVFMQIFNHGITAAALFYFVGLLEQRRGLRGIGDFGGLMQRTPLLCGWMSVAMFSSLGLPGLNGFVGEFLIFKGSFAMTASFTAAAVLGLLFTAVVFMRAMQSLFSGPLVETSIAFPDLRSNEKWVVIPVTLLMFTIGIVPQFLLNIFNSTVVQMTRLFA